MVLPASSLITFSSTSDYIATSLDEKMTIYDYYDSSNTIGEISFNSVINAIKFNPTKDEILVGLVDESLYMYNCKTEKINLIDGDLNGKIESIQFRNDMCLTSLNLNKRVQFRNIDNYIKVGEINGFINISPDGEHLLFSSSNDLIQAPILSTNDLIELGKTIIGNRVLTPIELKRYSITN